MVGSILSGGADIQNAINSSIDSITNIQDVMLKYKAIADQLQEDKKQFGLTFALQKLIAMADIEVAEKEILLKDLVAREGVKTSALDRQVTEHGFRQELQDEDRKKKTGKYMALGFAKAMKGQGNKRAPSSQGESLPEQKENNVLSGF